MLQRLSYSESASKNGGFGMEFTFSYLLNHIKNKTMNLTEEMAIILIGLVAIFILEFIALMKGIDGSMFASAIAGIGALIGWAAKIVHYRMKKGK